MPDTGTSNLGSASHTGESQQQREAHFAYDYTRRRVPMPVISYLAVADAPGESKGEGPAGRKALGLLKDYVEPAVIAEEELAGPHMEALIRDSMNKVNEALLSEAGETPSGTRASLTFVLASRDRAYIGHVGTCRVYLLHKNRLYDLTPSGAQVIRQPAVEQTPSLFPVAGEEPAGEMLRPATEPGVPGNLLGESPEPLVGYNEVEIEPGDTIILCSDGFWKTVSEKEIVENLLSAVNVKRSASQLVRVAFSRDASDNATMVVWQYVVPGESPVRDIREIRTRERREKVTEAMLIVLLGLVLAGIFAIGFAFGWRITDAFRKPRKEAVKEVTSPAEPEAPGEEAAGPPVEENASRQFPFTAVVSGAGVRVRRDADTGSDVVGLLREGQQVTVTEETAGTDGEPWLKVKGTLRASGKDIEAEGYVRKDLLERVSTLPGATTPAPTP